MKIRAHLKWHRADLSALPGSAPGGAALRPAGTEAYLLYEALVYIGVIVVLLGAGAIAMHRCIDSSLVLRRSAEQITHTMHIGELWRADVRNATRGARIEVEGGAQTFRLDGRSGSVEYRFDQGAVYRRLGAGPSSRVLDKVRSSSMRSEARPPLMVWCWDLELAPQSRGAARSSRVRPLFSFLATPPLITSEQ